MKVYTRTSVYDLSKDGDLFVLKKDRLIDNRKSSLLPGFKVRVKENEIGIDAYHSLSFYNIYTGSTWHTSRVMNWRKVSQWLKDNSKQEGQDGQSIQDS